MNKQDKYELIEAFLDDHETVEERERVRKAIEADPGLEKEIELHRQLAEVTRGEQFHELREVLRSTDAEWKNQEKPAQGRVVNLSVMKWAVAAAVVALIGISLWFNITTPSAAELFAANFEPYDMVLTQRSMGEEISPSLDEAIINYAQGNYDKAEVLFQQLALNTPDQPVLKMYECVSALALGQSATAISCFNGMMEIPNLEEQARWYLGLAFLQKGDVDMARETFLRIEVGAYQYDRAQKILKEL